MLGLISDYRLERLINNSLSSSSTICAFEIEMIIDRLKLECHRDSTKQNYLKIWKIFNQFIIRLDKKPSTWEDRVTLFVGYLVEKNRKSSTVKSYVSALKAVLSYGNIILQEDRVLLSTLTRACQLKNDRVENKLPIRKSFLTLLVQKLDKILDQQPYLKKLYRTLLLTAYFGLFRIGEVTLRKHVIKAIDMHIGENKQKNHVCTPYFQNT